MRSIPKSRAAVAATTGGVATAIPTGTYTIKVLGTDGPLYVGMGEASTAPAASASNTVYLATTTIEFFNVNPSGGGIAKRPGYLYLYSETGTVAARVSFYGG